MNQCCIALGNAIQENDNPIFYKSFLREYNLKLLPVFAEGKLVSDNSDVVDTLKYCPWCGKEFLKSLRDEWADEVEEKFKVESILDKEELKKVPEVYMTEEWWRKKGL